MDAPLTLNRGKSPADMWGSSSIHTHPNRGSSNTATCRLSARPPPPSPPTSPPPPLPPLRLALPEGPRLACPLGPLDGPRLAFAPAPASRDAAAACPRSRKLIGVAADHTRAVEGLSAWSCHTARSSNNRPSNEPPGGGGAMVGDGGHGKHGKGRGGDNKGGGQSKRKGSRGLRTIDVTRTLASRGGRRVIT